ncbi:MAG: GNAT family N-acetyltransferase [Parachlamydiaceae bacterium]|nr:GNAT family N-acetyltransferase [Parachlamydiaceae bacterium]
MKNSRKEFDLRLRFFIVFLFIFSQVDLFAANENIHMDVFKGKQISPYVGAMASLAAITFKEPPYLYDGSIDGYMPFFQNYANTDTAVACLLFDGSRLIGMTAGVALDKARQFYQQPFLHKGYDLRSIYNLGEVLVLKEYRGRGYGKELYKNLENTVRRMPQFHTMTFCTYPDNWSIKNNLEDTNETFWKNAGFVENRDIYVILDWINIGQKVSTPHKLFFWMKPLK